MIRRAATTLIACVVAVSPPLHAAQQPRLEGCDAPQVTAERMRQMSLTTSEWRSVTASQIREKWRGLLNQVACPQPAGGTFVLAAFDRVIRDQPQCGVTFALHAEPGMQRLVNANVHYSAERLPDVLRAVALFVSVWRPDKAVEIEIDDKEWMERVKRGEDATGALRWQVRVGAACTVSFQIDKSIHRSAPGWTAKVSLSAHSDCGK
jgi:hypothetical protein